MKFETTPAFDSDFKRLKPEHHAAFKEVVGQKFAAACDEYAENITAGKPYVWPRSLRVKGVVGATGILEMTWSFANPDGRATFEFITKSDGIYCRWRRVGDHGVFKEP
jgi:hypothetical protein